MAGPRWRLDERHDLLAECPAGAGGAVWLVRDRQSGAEFAVKILRPELTADPDAVEELRALLDAVRRLGHPGVLAVDEVVTHEDRTVLIAKRVPGEDLGALLARQGALAPTAAAAVAAQLCDALAAAHAAGVVHGDVKPSNLLLEADPQTGALVGVRLTDFGIAGLIARAAGRAPDAALPAVYQAPEVGAGQPATVASDMYAVGILLYEALAGAPPLRDRPADGATGRRGEDQPARIPALPDPLWLLVTACLDEHPQHRPSAATLASLLREVAPPAGAALAAIGRHAPAAPASTGPTQFPAPRGTGQATSPPALSPASLPAFALRRPSLLGRRRRELAVLIVSVTLGVTLALLLGSHGSGTARPVGLPVDLASAVTGAAGGASVGPATGSVTAALTPSASASGAAQTGTGAPSASTAPGPTASGAASTTATAVTVAWQCAQQSAPDNIDMKACIGIGSDQRLYLHGAFRDRDGQNLTGVELTLVGGGRALLTTSTSCDRPTCAYSAGPYNPARGSYQVVAVVNSSSDQVISPSQSYPAG